MEGDEDSRAAWQLSGIVPLLSCSPSLPGQSVASFMLLVIGIVADPDLLGSE
jgi:hypothetical protein